MKLKKFKYKKVKSTNNTAIRIIKETKHNLGMVVAETQVNGRGQYGRKWISSKGNLFISFFNELNKTKLKEIVINLESLGGAQYAKGHYVAISSIFYPQTLEFVVYKKRKTDLENIRMMLRILDYFKNNETGNIVEIDY